MPYFKDVPKVGNGAHLRDTCGRHRTSESSGNNLNLKAMVDSILCGQYRDRKVRMAEFNCIGDNLALGV
jgi:hypothetical protein